MSEGKTKKSESVVWGTNHLCAAVLVFIKEQEYTQFRRINTVDCRYRYTEAFKIAYASKRCRCFINSSSRWLGSVGETASYEVNVNALNWGPIRGGLNIPYPCNFLTKYPVSHKFRSQISRKLKYRPFFIGSGSWIKMGSRLFIILCFFLQIIHYSLHFFPWYSLFIL